MNKKVLIAVIVVLILAPLMLYRWVLTRDLSKSTLKAREIDAIQIVYTGGDPQNGYKSKIITDVDEITKIVEAFHNAKIGRRVEDPPEGGYTHCYLFSNDEIVHEFYFNGIQTEEIRRSTGYYNLQYQDKTISELYDKSKAEPVCVSAELLSRYPEITLTEVYEGIERDISKIKLKAEGIDAIQIIVTGGDPNEGYQSLIITDQKDITKIVGAFNSAKIGNKVEDPPEGGYTHCYLFSNDEIVHEFYFNGIQTKEIRRETGNYYMQYQGKTIMELCAGSNAENVGVSYELLSRYPEITLTEVYEGVEMVP